MADNKKPFPINVWNGGYCGNLSADQLQPQQASDLDNIIISPFGTGWRTRLGNTKQNATAINSGANIQGLGYLLTTAAAERFGAVAGSKFYGSADTCATWTDRTGTLTITSGANNLWSFCTFNDLLIGFGGSATGPDAPFKWTGAASDATALGGSPPSAYGCFSVNNRVFAFNTAAAPSTIYWSVLANAEDWTGSGSGSAVVGSVADNQAITGAAVLSANYVLVFKKASTYQMVISTAPFPIYSLFDKVGCVGKHAIVNVDGVVYWINQWGRMVSTNGDDLKTYPASADDLWSALVSGREPYITGFRQRGSDYDHIVWCITETSGSTNNYAIVWDLLNNCWLKRSTGYKMNAAVANNSGSVFMGGYDGYIYRPEQAAKYSDDSEANPGTITAFWQTGWINPSTPDEVVQVQKLTANYKTRASGNITITYGFDFGSLSKSLTLSQAPTASETLTSRQSVLTGRGNYIMLKISQSSSTIDTSFNALVLRGKVYGQKKISAS